MADNAIPPPEPAFDDKLSQSPAAKLLGSFIKNRFSELAKDRLGEDECWFVSGLMNLGRQWQTREKGRIRAMAASDYGNGWTAPVSDHFSKTIAANSNSLGARLPRMTALSGNWDARSRRAAAYAEAAIDTANKESGMDTLNAVLAQQTVLWGISVVKDSIAFDLSTEDVPIIGQSDPRTGQQIPTGTAPAPPASSPTPAAAAPESLNPSGVPSTNPQPGQPVAPTVGSPQQPISDEEPELSVIGSERIPAPRLKSTLPSPFAVYIPRDCQDANMAPEVYERVPYTLGEAREMFPDYATQLSADGQGADSQGDTAYADSTSESLAAFYQSQLRRMASALTSSGGSSTAGQSTKDADSTVSSLTCIEGWVEWSRLTKQIQQAIEAEWKDAPSVVEEYADKGMSRVSAAVTYGVYGIVWQDQTLQWSENPLHGETPYTFFMWEKNSLNPYGKGGLGVVLTPLQRQLNRLDALHDRQMLSTGTTKVLIGESQQYADTWTGDPVDVMRYDDMAGKHAPQLFPAGNAGGIPQKRAQIVEEFANLGYTEGVQSGQAPGGVDSFRGIAYLGAKAEELRGTQRALCEMSHEMRSRKILRMAKQVWTTPRKVKVAGPNNRFGMELLEGADIDFDTDQISVVEGSSRPKSLAEKQDAINTLATAGLIDVTDPEVRDYIYDLVGMPEIDLVNELDHSKAERDLQQVLDGMQPVSSPYQNWGIVLKTFTSYTLTEEYEGLPASVQTAILSYASWLQEMAAPPAPMVPPTIPGKSGPFAGNLPSSHPAQTLSKPPSKTNPQAQQIASQAEGNGGSIERGWSVVPSLGDIMAFGAGSITQTSRYVEGSDQIRRFQIVGDTSYPTGGYVLLNVSSPGPGGSPLRGVNQQTAVSAVKRIVGIRHRTVASATLGNVIAVDTYTAGFITTLTVAIVTGSGELANGTNASTLNVELIIEGY